MEEHPSGGGNQRSLLRFVPVALVAAVGFAVFVALMAVPASPPANAGATGLQMPGKVATAPPTPIPTGWVPSPGPTIYPTPTPCTLQFVDVPPGSPFTVPARCMACHGGFEYYYCGGPGEPCPGLYFRPNAPMGRQDFVVAAVEQLRFNDPIPCSRQTFADVPTQCSGWGYMIERAVIHGLVTGYPCDPNGGSRPCDSLHRPYFLPNNNITRGQASKILSIGMQYRDPLPSAPTFVDVPFSDPFASYIERIKAHSVAEGYTCGSGRTFCLGPVETCPGQYFRPCNSLTRGQAAIMLANAFPDVCGGP